MTTFESFKKFMPEENWWPRDEMWNKHYFGQNALIFGIHYNILWELNRHEMIKFVPSLQMLAPVSYTHLY